MNILIGNRIWQAGRVAWLGAFLVAAQASSAAVAGGAPLSSARARAVVVSPGPAAQPGVGSPGRQHVFRLAGPRLAPTRAG